MTGFAFQRADLMPLAFAVSGLVTVVAMFLPAWVSVPAAAPAPQAALPTPVIVRPLGAYVAISARPLFNEDRQRDPPPMTAAQMKPALPNADNYQLVGIVLTADLRMALVQRRQGGETVRLHEGDTLDGWTVKAIGAPGVELTGANSTAQLTIPGASQHKAPGIANMTTSGSSQSTAQRAN